MGDAAWRDESTGHLVTHDLAIPFDVLEDTATFLLSECGPAIRRLVAGLSMPDWPEGTRRAISSFSEHFYKKVYPPDPKDAERTFDFADYIFRARAEIGLYTTPHRLRARVPTSAILRRLVTASRKEDAQPRRT